MKISKANSSKYFNILFRFTNFLLGFFIIFYIASNIPPASFDFYLLLILYIDILGKILARGYPYEIKRQRSFSTAQKLLNRQINLCVLFFIAGICLALVDPTISVILIGGALVSIFQCSNNMMKIRGFVLSSNFQPLILRGISILGCFSCLIWYFGGSSVSGDLTLGAVAAFMVLQFIWHLPWIKQFQATPGPRFILSLGKINPTAAINHFILGFNTTLTPLMVSLFQPQLLGELKIVFTSSIVINLIYSGLIDDGFPKIREMVFQSKKDELFTFLRQKLKLVLIFGTLYVLIFFTSGQWILENHLQPYAHLFSFCILALCLKLVLDLIYPYEMLLRLIDQQKDLKLISQALILKATFVLFACLSENFYMIICADILSDIIRKLLYRRYLQTVMP